MFWYSLRVISGKEKSAEEQILRAAGDNEITNEIEEVFVPYEKVVEMRNNKKRIREKMFFPGYVLIKMDLDSKTKYLVEGIDGVMNFVGSKGSPQPIRPEEISRIIGVGENGEDREAISIPFKVGDPIRVTDGPFLDFSGFVQEVNNEKQKLKVSVSLFGKPTPIELDYLQVESE